MRSTTILPALLHKYINVPFPLVGTNLAAIIGGQLIGVAPQARLLCIKVGDLDPDVPNMIEAIRFAVQLAGSASTPSVILLPFVSGFFGQAFDDAVRIPTVSWNNTYIKMRSTGRRRHQEWRPLDHSCRRW